MSYAFDPPRTEGNDRGFVELFLLLQVIVVGLGAATLQYAPAAPVSASAQTKSIQIRFEPPPAPVAEPEPVEVPAVVTPQAVEKNPPVVEAPKVEPPVPTTPSEPTPVPNPPQEPEPPVRRVYGVRKVFSRGLGHGTQNAPGIVSKRGNSLGGETDTLVATPEDLREVMVPLSTVSEAPSPRHREKPGYSDLMREHRAEGIVSAKLLIDTEGRVREVDVVSDFGLDSRELAIRAFQKFRFSPARKGSVPVAVWIVHKIRFEFQE